MDSSILPLDSQLHLWIRALSITEIPVSYQMACGLSAVGAVLKRQVYFDHERFRVWPNLNVMLVGPSGIGKDVVINATKDVLVGREGLSSIGGRTVEYCYERLRNGPSPSCTYIMAKELSNFFGQRDYEDSKVQAFTELLTNDQFIDVSTKGEGTSRLTNTTITMHTGTTEDWLWQAMPPGALDGGFLPRFLIVVEPYGTKFVSLVKHSLTMEEREAAQEADEGFREFLDGLENNEESGEEEVPILMDARALYDEWYRGRFTRFSKAVAPYANRSRNAVLQMALLCAVSRGRNYIEERDVQFGIDMMDAVAPGIERVAKPPTLEAQCARVLVDMLPASRKEIVRSLRQRFQKRIIEESLRTLQETGEVVATASGFERRP